MLELFRANEDMDKFRYTGRYDNINFLIKTVSTLPLCRGLFSTALPDPAGLPEHYDPPATLHLVLMVRRTFPH